MSAASHTPARSIEQRREALELANAIRLRRAALRRDLRAGRAVFADALNNPPEWLLGARVYDVLLAVPYMGRAKADWVFRRAGVSQSKTFGGLTARQRRALVSVMLGGGAVLRRGVR